MVGRVFVRIQWLVCLFLVASLFARIFRDAYALCQRVGCGRRLNLLKGQCFKHQYPHRSSSLLRRLHLRYPADPGLQLQSSDGFSPNLPE